MIYTINAVERIQDGGDGSTSATIYNTIDDLINDHWKMKDLTLGTAEYEQTRAEILDEDDPYENGYIDRSVKINIEIFNGEAKIRGYIHVSGG